ncbi:MAG TPA: ATP-binding protein [Oligoflexus sp.]|uniref:ATP-binding protein n=1 Tax=Oligoflexus sp. TaxID=1971216 RepID=UPI002D7F0284|nr:ATP-binding protein [Oligoflexus sp.]HET9239932.1 ATP-binding protein [Oligoflexus sp.]
MKLTYKVLVLLIVSIVGTFSITTAIELSKLEKDFSEQNSTAHKIILTNLVSNLAGAMFNIDTPRINAQVTSSFEFGNIASILLIDDRGKITAYYTQDPRDNGPVKASDAAYAAWSEEVLDTFRKPSLPYNSLTSSLVQDLGILSPGIQRYKATLWYNDGDNQTFVGHVLFDFSVRQVAAKVRTAAITKIISATIMATILLFVIFFFLRISVLTRVEWLKSAANRIRQRDFTARTALKGSDEIAVLGNTFQSMSDEIQSYQMDLENKVKDRTRELQESRDKIKVVFDTIDQGILSFDGSFKVDSEYSIKSLEILGVSGEDLLQKGLRACLLDRIQMTEDRRDQMLAAINSIIGDDEIALIGNLPHLPREGSIQDSSGSSRFFRFAWYPIVNKEDDSIAALLVSITDLTKEKQEEEHKRQLSIRNQQLIALVASAQNHGMGSIGNFLNQGPRIIKDIQQNWDKPDTLLHLHTIKGEARSLDFNDLAASVHDSETAVKQKVKASIMEQLQTTLQIFQSYISIFEQTFNNQKRAQSTFVQAASRLHQNLRERLAQEGLTLERFEILDHYGNWDEQLVEQVIAPCLVHAVTNSLDHGFLLPEKKHGEKRPIILSLRSRPTEFGFAVEISDQGYGIDEDAVLSKAKELGIDTKAFRADEIIFMPEFSTAEQLTISSGRGIGMAAIKKLVEHHEGRIHLQSRFKQGTTLTLEFPKAQKRQLSKAG